jgi:diaminopimelate epimerase
MKKIKFTKMHGIGNDFVILKKQYLKENEIELTTELIQSICHRNFWIWSDGLLVIDKGKKAEFKYIMYNPDGSEAEMCGNGIRCYMKYLIDNKLTEAKNIDIETWIWVLNVSMKWKIITVSMWQPKVIENKYQNIGKNNICWAVFAVDKLFKFIPISMWNPHAVILLKNTWVKDFDVNKYGAVIESDTEIFPQKTNVEFIEKLSDTEINMRVYERWAWETLACWTWACASVVAGILTWNLKKNVFIKINLKGGILEIKWSWNFKDSVIMRGWAETTFEWTYFIT